MDEQMKRGKRISYVHRDKTVRFCQKGCGYQGNDLFEVPNMVANSRRQGSIWTYLYFCAKCKKEMME